MQGMRIFFLNVAWFFKFTVIFIVLNKGNGTFYWNDGDVYIGEFSDGKYDGQGTYYYNNGMF